MNRLPLDRFTQRTLPSLLLATATRFPERAFIHWISPANPAAGPLPITFGGFARGVSRAAAFLRARGVGPGDRVLLLAENSPQWQMLSLGAQILKAEPAALFANLAAEQARTIAGRVRPRAIFVSTAQQWAKLAPDLDGLRAAGLTAVVCAEQLPELAPGFSATTLEEACGEDATELGESDLARLVAAVGAEDPFLLLFTSGTTGRPKGVRLPQRSVVHAIDGGAGACRTTVEDLGVHFLPFAHVAGQDEFFIALAQGHSLAMVARKDDLDRALALSPTYLFSVPLLYERMMQAVQTKLASLPRPLSRLAQRALAGAARARVDGSRSTADRALAAVADLLVGRPLKRKLGGRMRGVFSGGAPASTALFRFFEGLGIPFVELYGMTETAGLIASNLFDGPRRPGTAGLVSPDHELRLAKDGELLLKGPLLLSGYLEPADDEGAFDETGFFRTGDLASLDADGTLRIEGRKKHLLVLSTGKKVAPEPLELAIAATSPFEGAVLLGEGQPFVAAAVFVGHAELKRIAAVGRDAAESLLPRARSALAGRSEFELPRRLVVIPGSPHEHPSLVTPTLKIRREAVADFLGPAIRTLWQRKPPAC
jgi:long-chain acyl-CoA synthetase